MGNKQNKQIIPPVPKGKRLCNCGILLLGLDSAGKTTMIYALGLKDPIRTVPTIGFNIETTWYIKPDIEINTWDVGGRDKLRDLWRHYYPGTNAIIFVVDSADKMRLNTAKEELHLLLDEFELRNAVLLVFANKQDLPYSFTSDEIGAYLQLHEMVDIEYNDIWNCLYQQNTLIDTYNIPIGIIKIVVSYLPKVAKPSDKINGRPYFVQGCSAINRDGLYDGLQWLNNQLPSTNTKQCIIQ